MDYNHLSFPDPDTILTPVCKVLRDGSLLERIASHLPRSTLLEQRTVCHRWNTEFARAVRNCVHVTVIRDNSETAMDLIEKRRTRDGVENVSALQIMATRLTESLLVKSIMFYFGPTISFLKLNTCFISGEDLSALLRTVPCLETLVILELIGRILPVSVAEVLTAARLSLPILKDVDWTDMAEGFNILGNILKAFPSIESLELSKQAFENNGIYAARERQVVQHSIKSLEVLFWDQLNLESEGLDSALWTFALNIEFTALAQLRLINMYMKEFADFKRVAKVLDEVRNTLEELELSLHREDSADEETPLCPAELEIFVSESGEGFPNLQKLICPPKLFHSVKILQKLLSPKLTDVSFETGNSIPWHDCMYWWNLLDDHTVRQEKTNDNVKTASLGAIDVGCLWRISKGLFPYLTSLELEDYHVGDSALGAIFSGFRNLERFEVVLGRSQRPKVCTVTDTGITGISPERLRTIRVGDDPLRTEPWIGLLENLQVVNIVSLTNCDLTDDSLLWGFLSLPKLQLCSYPQGRITKRYATPLKNLMRYNRGNF